MNRLEKRQIIDSLKSDFTQSNASFLIHLKGATVGQIQALRRGVRQQGGSLKVAKNTLMRIASQEVPGVKELDPYFKDQVGVVFAYQDGSAVAKVLSDFVRDNEKVSLVAGCFEQQVVGKEMIVFIGSLPSKEIILAQVCGTLQAPIAVNVSIMQQLVARLLWTLKQASEKQ